MSEPRQTQILEEELAKGWTAELVTVAAPGTEVVKADPGKVARIRVVSAGINVTPVDGANNAWGALTNAAELDLGGTPMQFNTSIGLTFSAAGSAWILYK
jgi:16S rRNA C1402 (ribose-2'-O) methylase RsmI